MCTQKNVSQTKQQQNMLKHKNTIHWEKKLYIYLYIMLKTSQDCKKKKKTKTPEAIFVSNICVLADIYFCVSI